MSQGPAPQSAQPPTCRSCGYDLTGITQGSACPECGTIYAGSVERTTVRRRIDSLTDTSRGYQRLLTYSTAIAAPGLVATLATSHAVAEIPTLNNAAIFAASVVVFTLGIVLATLKRPQNEATIRDEMLDGPWFRGAVLVAQAVWVVAAGIGLWLGAQGGGGSGLASAGQTGALEAVFFILQGAGTFGIVAIAIYFSALAEWANDAGLADRLRFTAWGMSLAAIGFPLLMLVAWIIPQIRGFLYLVQILLYFVVFVSVLLMMFSMLQIPLMCFWSLRYSVKADQRDQRIAERRAREAAERDARIKGMDTFPAPPPPPIDRSDEPIPVPGIDQAAEAASTQQPSPEDVTRRRERPQSLAPKHPTKNTGEYRIDPSGDGETYDLAD